MGSPNSVELVPRGYDGATARTADVAGLEKAERNVLPTLNNLLENREMMLDDGRFLMKAESYDALVEQGYSKEALESQNLVRVHPDFRVIALGLPVPPTLLAFSEKLQRAKETNADYLALSLSTRQLLRICRRLNAFPEQSLQDLRPLLHDTLLTQFLSSACNRLVDSLLDECKVPVSMSATDPQKLQMETIREEEGRMHIGDISYPIQTPSNPELVPQPHYFDIPKHTRCMKDMLQDVVAGQKHMLLIGNQGVGKNKLADRLLQLLQQERDCCVSQTTVQTLTLVPTLVDGKIEWEDSPLVRAAKTGRTLIVDEADKAPLEVVCVLKGLIEDGEMLLVRLAIDNPDEESELSLLTAYAPSVSIDILRRLCRAFAELRELVENGTITYPYSTREAVAVAKHLEQFPNDGVASVLRIYPEIPARTSSLAAQSTTDLVGPVNDPIVPTPASPFAQVYRAIGFRPVYYWERLTVTNCLLMYRKHSILELENEYMQWELNPVLVNLPDKREVAVLSHLQVDYTFLAVHYSVLVTEDDIVLLGTRSHDLPEPSGKLRRTSLREDLDYSEVREVQQAWQNESFIVNSVQSEAGDIVDMEVTSPESQTTKNVVVGSTPPQKNASDDADSFRCLPEVLLRPNNDPHIGGNTWAGELEDPTRLDWEAEVAPIDSIRATQCTKFRKRRRTKCQLKHERKRCHAQEALAEKLREIDMSEREWETYQSYFKRVERESSQLRAVLANLEAVAQERNWLRHQSSGELDDGKLVDGVAGERLRRLARDPVRGVWSATKRPQGATASAAEDGCSYAYCRSGDHTVEAVERGVQRVAALEGDDRFVFVVSDANLERYGIEPRYLGRKLLADPGVQAHALFIASFADEAEPLPLHWGNACFMLLLRSTVFAAPGCLHCHFILKNADFHEPSNRVLRQEEPIYQRVSLHRGGTLSRAPGLHSSALDNSNRSRIVSRLSLLLLLPLLAVVVIGVTSTYTPLRTAEAAREQEPEDAHDYENVKWRMVPYDIRSTIEGSQAVVEWSTRRTYIPNERHDVRHWDVKEPFTRKVAATNTSNDATFNAHSARIDLLEGEEDTAYEFTVGSVFHGWSAVHRLGVNVPYRGDEAERCRPKHVHTAYGRTPGSLSVQWMTKQFCAEGDAQLRLVEGYHAHVEIEGPKATPVTAWANTTLFEDDGKAQTTRWMHVVRLEGLKPDTRYTYVVGNAYYSSWSIPHYSERFRLMPSNENEDVQTVHIGGHSKKAEPKEVPKNWFYSFDVGLVHFTVISTEIYFKKTFDVDGDVIARQEAWLEQDLAKANANREQTPWLVVIGHRPMYCTSDNTNCGDKAAMLRDRLEDKLFKHGVDVYLCGHQHNYERAFDVYKSQTWKRTHNMRATTHILTGASGQYLTTIMRKAFERPAETWDAFRNNIFGYSRMEVVNATHLHWQQVEADPENPAARGHYGEIIDDVWLVQERHEALNYKKNYGCSIPPHLLAERMGQFVHYYTLYGSIRPFGTAIMLAGYDQDTKKSSLYMVEPSGVTYVRPQAEGSPSEKDNHLQIIVDACRATAAARWARASSRPRQRLRKVVLFVFCCSLNTLHDEVRHSFELELSWICEETNWQHHLVPDNLRDEVNEWAVQSIKEDEMADDDDDEDE
ncbi:Nucleophile aminohydrolase [Phytophthora cactorum]|nr:Nucleophile aminohydrolase [Phytophthora cactorum]